MDYRITLSERALAGLDAERLAYNANNPQNELADISAYLDWLIGGAAETAAMKHVDLPPDMIKAIDNPEIRVKLEAALEAKR